MANFIQTLQAANKAQEENEAAMQERINEFRVHLQSAKFQGFEEDGTLRAQIWTSDVQRWLDYIQRGN